MRAVQHVNEAGGERGPGGLPMLLPGLNLIYGMPGETHATHIANLTWLTRIYHAGLMCHRTNVRQVRAFPGTPSPRRTASRWHRPPSTSRRGRPTSTTDGTSP